MNLFPDSLPVDRERLARELAELRTQMERFPKRRHRLEFRAAELAVRLELLDARLRGRKMSAAHPARGGK